MNKRSLWSRILIVLSVILLTSCSGFFEKDNTPTPTPLSAIKAEIQPKRLWSVKTGSQAEAYLRLAPSLYQSAIYTASSHGLITSINRNNGTSNWQVNLNTPLAAGPGTGDHLIVVGSRQGEVIALNELNGEIRWRQTVAGEVMAKPAIQNGMVIVKTVNGHVQALSTQDGHMQWSYTQTEPSIILYGSSAPFIFDRNVIVGFANGHLVRLSLHQGQVLWQQAIAYPEGLFAIQRMIDIDADPIIFEHRIFAATYQGKIAALEWTSGRVLWSHDISSYTGMAADSRTVYISDANSRIWAFNVDSGLVNWRQTQLEARVTTPPALIGNYVVVGDAEGYLHWLDKRDGHFAARESVGGKLYAAPLVQDGIVYVLSNNGYLTAYKL